MENYEDEKVKNKKCIQRDKILNVIKRAYLEQKIDRPNGIFRFSIFCIIYVAFSFYFHKLLHIFGQKHVIYYKKRYEMCLENL